MFYVVGDSNAVYTGRGASRGGKLGRGKSRFLLDSSAVDEGSLCKETWTCAQVLTLIDDMVNYKPPGGDSIVSKLCLASGFLLFVGMNDSADIANSILGVLDRLMRLTAFPVPIFVAAPFCVPHAPDPNNLCEHRTRAARELKVAIQTSYPTVKFIDLHITSDGFLKRNLATKKKNSTQYDPLHMADIGYRKIAEVVNDFFTQTNQGKRAHRPKIPYEAEPAPAPRVAHARHRASHRPSSTTLVRIKLSGGRLAEKKKSGGKKIRSIRKKSAKKRRGTKRSR
jgi:hypothetical protein